MLNASLPSQSPEPDFQPLKLDKLARNLDHLPRPEPPDDNLNLPRTPSSTTHHHVILPISPRHGAPATARCAPTDNALPSLLVWFWLLFYDALSHHVYVFLFARMHLDAGLPTQEEMHRTETCQCSEE